MKRYLIFALPILGMLMVLGLGLLLVRTHTIAIRPRFGGIRKAVAGVVDEVADELEEAPE